MTNKYSLPYTVQNSAQLSCLVKAYGSYWRHSSVCLYYKRDKNLFVKYSDTTVLSCNYLQLTDMHQSYFDALTEPFG